MNAMMTWLTVAESGDSFLARSAGILDTNLRKDRLVSPGLAVQRGRSNIWRGAGRGVSLAWPQRTG